MRVTAVLVAVLVAAPPAAAGELRLDGGRLSYRAAPGDTDSLAVEVRPSGVQSHFVVSATSGGSTSMGVTAGPGCEAAPGPYDMDEIPHLFLCRVPLVELSADIDLGDGDDALVADRSVRISASGGDGHDSMRANGRLDGGPGNDVLAGLGNPQYERQRLYGGPGDDSLTGSTAPDLLVGGAGGDVFELIGPRGARDGSRDTVDARDGELDRIACRSAGRSDRLLLDGTDWPQLDRTRTCRGMSRSSPARALPAYIDSPAYEVNEGTWVGLYCPHDARVCEGTIEVRVSGRKLGPKHFRLRRGQTREFKVARGEYNDPDCQVDVPALVTVRSRRGTRVLPATAVLAIPVCPYDSA